MFYNKCFQRVVWIYLGHALQTTKHHHKKSYIMFLLTTLLFERFLVQDDPKLPGDSGEVPISK